MFSKDNDIDIDYSIILRNKINLLINDDSWIKLFGDVEDKGIVKIRKELEDIIRIDKETNRELGRAKAEKKKVMAKILNISNEVNNKSNNELVNELEKCQERVIELNEYIDELTFKSEMLPKKVREGNYLLLKETIRYAYRELKSNQNNLHKVNDNIEDLREQLKIHLEEKHDYEERITSTYSFLHGILGNKEMEKLDKKELY